jgi:hypothetical protein
VGELEKYNAAKRALAEAHRVDEAKDIRDKAMAMRLYAMQARDRVLIDQATEIRLRAERRAGELLRDAEKAKPRGSNQHKHKDRSHAATDPPTLAELGINKSQSSRWQKLAEIDGGEFEDVVARARQGASAALDRAQRPKPAPEPKPKPKPKPDVAAVVATCVRSVKSALRAALSALDPKLDSEGRLDLFDQIETAIRAIRAEAAGLDHLDKTGFAASVERWSEQ